jgi:Flp pilus assembly protein TadG
MRGWRSLPGDKSGLATIEFSFLVTFLAFSLLNVSDIAVFMFDKIQVNNATQMGAQAAMAACDTNHLPVSVKCPSMNTAVTIAVQSTSLGTNVTIQTGYPSDGYYCVNTSGALQYMSTVTAPPNNCSAAGNAGTAPAEYVQVQTSYPYTPIFPGLSVASVFPAAITATSWVRLS